MSNSKRRRGERNWADPVPTTIKTQTRKIKSKRSQKQFFYLRVHCVNEAPYQFIVTDVSADIEWLVQEGVDGALTIDERPESTIVKDRTIFAAIYRGWPQLKE